MDFNSQSIKIALIAIYALGFAFGVYTIAYGALLTCPENIFNDSSLRKCQPYRSRAAFVLIAGIFSIFGSILCLLSALEIIQIKLIAFYTTTALLIFNFTVAVLAAVSASTQSENVKQSYDKGLNTIFKAQIAETVLQFVLIVPAFIFAFVVQNQRQNISSTVPKNNPQSANHFNK